MLKINLDDGRTLSYDLTDPIESRIWRLWQADPQLQHQITGMGIHHDGVFHVLPIPVRFRRRSFSARLLGEAEKPVGEQVICQADAVRITMSVYRQNGMRPKMVRVDVVQTGTARWLTRNE